MKISYALVAVATVTVLAVGVLAPMASADTVTQPITLVGPAGGAKVASPFVTFSWVAPADEQAGAVNISTSPKTVNGLLPRTGTARITSDYFDAGATTATDEGYSWGPGTYYWQVTTHDSTGASFVSPVGTFVVPVFFVLSKTKAKAITESYNHKRAVSVSTVMKCNYEQDQYYLFFRMDTYKGKKKLGTSMVQQGNCVGMRPIKTQVLFEPGHVKKGTKLTLKIYGISTLDSTVRWGGKAIKKAKGPVTTIRFTWKG